jgi:hypothetical protein
MIGVICADRERPVVREFFELFKTPWAFWEPGRSYDVVVVTAAVTPPESAAARLVIAFGASETGGDGALGIQPGSWSAGDLLKAGDWQLPLYAGALTLTGAGRPLGWSVRNGGPLIQQGTQAGCPTIWCGYDLFAEVEFLLSAGQPPEHAATPTLDLHIALVRHWIVDAGITLWEIPPVPPGYQFIACLTHDVDFLGIRRHRWDRTLAGFLLRASIGSLAGLIHGRRSLRQLGRNWIALLSLPLVYAGVLPDFWLPFDRYMSVDGDSRSTFFVIPFRDLPGRGVDGPGHPRRAVRYGAEEISPWLPELKSRGFEIGVHGIDAWGDPEAAASESQKIAELTGETELGVRMHWLYFDASSFAVLDRAGFAYDASIGYNDAVGFRAGTAQVFRPLSAGRLLELPLIVQDSALFFPGRMGCSETEAFGLCDRILDWTEQLGGVSTLSWHERSLVPERQWDGTYRWLLSEVQRRGAYVAPARDVVSWFSARRSVDLQGVEVGGDRLRAIANGELQGVAPPSLMLRLHAGWPEHASTGGSESEDIPVQAGTLSAFLSDVQAPAGVDKPPPQMT